MTTRWEWSLPPVPEAASTIRQHLRERCASLPPSVMESALLVATELVSNAVRHGDGELLVRLWVRDEGIRIEVSDGSPQYPAPATSDVDDLSGRGLQIVSALSSRWGAAPAQEQQGKTVWCELGTRGESD